MDKTENFGLKDINGNVKTYNIEIPEGIQNHEKIILEGKGKEGQNGGQNGDLILEVNIKENDNYKLDGIDIYKKIEITPWESALGQDIKVHGIDDEIRVHIPKGIGSGELITVKEQGYKDKEGNRGNLILETKIIMPNKMSEQEMEIYEKLKNVSKINPKR